MLRISINDIKSVIGKGGYINSYDDEMEDYINYNDDYLDIDEMDDFILLDEDEITYECCDCLECNCTEEFAEEIERKYRRK